MKKFLAILLVFVAFLAKAQTLGETFDVLSYEIHLSDFDFSARTLQGYTVVTANTTAQTNTIALELKSLAVTEVTCPGYGVSNFWQDGDMLYVVPNIPLPANAVFELRITYGGLTYNDGWGGILWTGNSTSGYYVCSMGVGFETTPHNLGKTWFPCVDNFTDKAIYDVYVTVPTDMTAVCGGNLVNDVDNGDGTHTVHYNMPQAIATYHISFVVGSYVEWSDTYNGVSDNIPVNVYVKPSQIGNVPGTFAHVKDIAAFFESCFGPYPFNRIGYAVTSVGCMEHVDNIGITSGVVTGDNSQEEYVAHEMSHMWFGNKVTCSTAEDMWLNEGFAQFCGMFYRSAVYGEDVFQSDMSAKINSIANWCKNQNNWIPLNNIPLSMTYNTDAVYNRGAVVVNTLMNYLDRETFLTAIRDYLDDYAYGAASSEQLRDALTTSTGVDMNGFFDTYVFTPGMPHYGIALLSVTPNVSQYDATVRMTYQHIGSSHVGDNNRVPVTFISQEGQMQTAMVSWDGAEAERSITLDINPAFAFIDYDNGMLDAKIDKNLTATGTATISQTRHTIKVNAVTDSVMLRSENHLVGPDDNTNIPALAVSTSHYWDLMRLDFGTADVSATFDYSNSTSADGDIIHTANDSAVLLYRPTPLEAWRTIPYTIYGSSWNWKIGRFIVDDVRSGQYTIGAIDKTHLATGEVAEDIDLLTVTPNPANDRIKVTTSFDDCKVLIVNALGHTVGTYSVKGKEMIIPVSDYKSGVYFVYLLDRNKKFISVEKLIKN
ncbi:MAG: T9SS type A sorting domain-containing protein [Bacteroidales bacterium]|nr:T9SS type A sorting domain-containing protein [Bacteroidales bacterium]